MRVHKGFLLCTMVLIMANIREIVIGVIDVERTEYVLMFGSGLLFTLWFTFENEEVKKENNK